MRFFDATLLGAVLLAGMGLYYGVSPTPAQQTPSQLPTQQRPPALPDARHSGNDEEESPMARQLAEQQAIRRNNARQKQIVDDTARLLQLAQQLKDEADKGKVGRDSKKAEEIEKLAKSVKERMREGQ